MSKGGLMPRPIRISAFYESLRKTNTAAHRHSLAAAADRKP
jgi:hypothetical protein